MKKLLICLFSLMLQTFAEELPFVVLIPSYNNAPWIVKTLNSICMQKYSNYRILYIDDCSTDNAVSIVENYIEQHGLRNRFTLIKNAKRYRKLKNVYNAIHTYCLDSEIVILIDCDDWLAHENVFSLINKIYQTNDTWFTYGQDCPQPKNIADQWGIPHTGSCHETPEYVIRNNSFRQYPFVYMHMRSFPAWLFKLIKLEDLMSTTVQGYKGKFFPACNDYAILYPILEMAGKHIYFNPQLIYYYNVQTPLNGFKIDRNLQISSAKEVKSKAAYQPLAQPILNRLEQYKNKAVNLVVFAQTIDQVETVLAKVPRETITNCIVVYSNEHAENFKGHETNAYRMLSKEDTTSEQLVSFLSADYTLFAHCTDNFSKVTNISADILSLEQTFAYAFYYGYAADQLVTQEINSDIYAAKLSCQNEQFKANSTHLSLYRTADFISCAQQIPQATIAVLLQQWENQGDTGNSIGLVKA